MHRPRSPNLSMTRPHVTAVVRASPERELIAECEHGALAPGGRLTEPGGYRSCSRSPGLWIRSTARYDPGLAHYLFNVSGRDQEQTAALLRAKMWGIGGDEKHRDALAPRRSCPHLPGVSEAGVHRSGRACVGST